MRYIRCNFCGADNTSHVVTGNDLLHGIRGQFTLVQCNFCGLIYQNPQPIQAELIDYYPVDYEPHMGTRKRPLGWLRRIDYGYGVYKRYRAIMRYFAHPGDVLDIGCGTGAFLEGMRNYGWKVAGIEPVTLAANYARNERGLEIQNTTVEKATIEPKSTDLVTMWNVLEHVSDPQQVLSQIYTILRSN